MASATLLRPQTRPKPAALLAALPLAAASIRLRQQQEASHGLPAVPDPVTFATETLGHDLWSTQRRILAALAQPGARVAVKACHASSKSFAAAEAVLWAPHAGGIAITTAPTGRQVRRVVWQEVRTMAPRAKQSLAGELLQTEYRLAPDRYSLGVATDGGVQFQGWHARDGGFLLIIGDEAPGLDPAVLTAVEGARAGGDVRVLLLGNPDVTSGPFYDVFHDQRAGWDCLTIDAFDTPNLAGLTLEDLLALPEHELDRNERPYLITRRFVREKYDEVGEDSAFWQSRIRGQFPAQSEDSLLSLAWLEAAAKREYVPREGDEWEAAVDVAGPGDAETVAGVRCGPQLVAMHGWSGADPRGDVLAWLAPWQERLQRVKVDSAGLGYYFARHLEEHGYGAVGAQPSRVVDVNVGEAAADKERYVNLKAELYWGLQLRFKPDARGHADVAANGDPQALPAKAIAQLSSIRYKHDARGRVVVESKEDARKRGVKCLATDTKIPTPKGWATIAELQVGDAVFDDAGAPTAIVAVSEVHYNHECYRVGFSDGHTIIADAEHLWRTRQEVAGYGSNATQRGVPRAEWRAWQPDGLRTTAQIAATLVAPGQRCWNHCVALAGPLSLPEAAFPIPPYVLGAWLGDGDSDEPRITIAGSDMEIVEAIEAEGVPIGGCTVKPSTDIVRVKLGANARLGANRADGVRANLHRLGVLGDKHIPMAYLRASIAQRFALLQGLLDTDGTIDQVRGRVEFSSSFPRLAADVMELLYSLGFKPGLHWAAPSVRGKRVKPSARIQFAAYADTPVFRLGRKLARQRSRPKGRPFSSSRRIVACDVVESVPVKCIRVQAASGMFLVGEGMIPTHNSPDWAECVMLLFAAPLEHETGFW